MTRANITELRNNLAEYLDRVCSGEEILVTRRGKVIARITSSADLVDAARRELESLRARAQIGDVESPIGIAWEAVDAGS